MIVVEDMNIKNGIILTTLATLTAFGQATAPSSRTAAPDSPKARLEFEVASIRPSPPATQGQVQVGLHVDGAMIRINYLNLKDYIAMAYQMKLYQVIGPEWLASDAERFDISAKLPEKSNRSQVDQMLRSLLQDRFQLKTHTESKEFPVYALVLGKSALQLKESPPDNVDADAGQVNVAAGGSRNGVSVNLGNGSSFGFSNNQLEARKLTMLSFADTLSRFMDRPVVDMTGLTGNYDFTLKLTEEDYQAMLIRSAVAAGVNLPPQALRVLDNASDESLFSAVESQGLKLERRKEPLPVLVVDHMEKVPTSN